MLDAKPTEPPKLTKKSGTPKALATFFATLGVLCSTALKTSPVFTL
jgi:hypothetical protein